MSHSPSFLRRIAAKANNLARYVLELGLPTGLAAFIRLEVATLTAFSKLSQKIISFPGLKHPLLLRPRTSDRPILEGIFLLKEYLIKSPAHEDALRAHYKSLLEKGKTPVIVDCGANIGLSAIWFAKAFPKAKVIAVEMENDNFAILEHNISFYPSIQAVKAGIYDKITKLGLTNFGGDPWGFALKEGSEGDIETTTIPDILKTVPKGELFIVKIDIEGGETELMRSNTAWVSQTPLIIFEEHDWMIPWRGTAQAFLGVLTQEKRDYLRRSENIFSFSHKLLAPSSARSKAA